jgi:hypothetical protein
MSWDFLPQRSSKAVTTPEGVLEAPYSATVYSSAPPVATARLQFYKTVTNAVKEPYKDFGMRLSSRPKHFHVIVAGTND